MILIVIFSLPQDFLPPSSPQRPKPVKSAHFEGSPSESSRHASFLEGISASLDILDDDHLGSIKSLVIDSKPKTPMDLIQVLTFELLNLNDSQADFPLTPSAVYSHGKLVTTDPKSPSHEADETDELDDVLTGIDQSSLAMQDLLNSEVSYHSLPSSHLFRMRPMILRVVGLQVAPLSLRNQSHSFQLSFRTRIWPMECIIRNHRLPLLICTPFHPSLVVSKVLPLCFPKTHLVLFLQILKPWLIPNNNKWEISLRRIISEDMQWT